MRTLLLVAGMLSLTGCAALFGSSQKHFDLQSSPPGADVIDAATGSWTQTKGSACSGSLEPLTLSS